MHRARQLELLDRIMAHRAAGDTTDMAPRHRVNPISDYTDPVRYEAEVEALFRRRPVMACTVGDVAEPGDYLTLTLLGVPVLVVRGEDGAIRAFRNVCRHRGACVASQDPAGAKTNGHTAKSFLCPYHAWSYRLDGRLIAPTHPTGFSWLDRDDNGLAPLRCGEAGGLVFVQLADGAGDPAGAALDAPAWLQGLGDELASLGFAGWRPLETRSAVHAMNWKLMYDTFLETYHLQHLHAATAARTLQSSNSLYDTWGPHAMMLTTRWSVAELDGTPREEWELLPHCAIAYHVLPNTVILHQQDHLEVAQILPEAVDRTRILYSLYAPAGETSEQQRASHHRAFDLLVRVIETEDFVMCEQIQRSFASGAQAALNFGRNEPALVHFHEAVDELVAADRSTPVGLRAS
ncbi:MAG: aromatic ring-hydroxylating oxygenase subunit alpha [Acidimicrobiales bacterium]